MSMRRERGPHDHVKLEWQICAAIHSDTTGEPLTPIRKQKDPNGAACRTFLGFTFSAKWHRDIRPCASVTFRDLSIV